MSRTSYPQSFTLTKNILISHHWNCNSQIIGEIDHLFIDSTHILQYKVNFLDKVRVDSDNHMNNSIIYIPENNEFKLNYDLKEYMMPFLQDKQIFIAYKTKSTGNINIYKFDLNKNIGIAGTSINIEQKKDTISSLIDDILTKIKI